MLIVGSPAPFTCTFLLLIISFIYLQDASTSDPGNSTSVAESDLSYHDDEDECGDAADDVSDYGDDDFLYEDDFDDYSIMQSQYDNVDLPPGVEASVPWLKDPSPSENIIAAMSTSTLPSLQAKFDAVDLPAGAEISIAPGLAENKMKAAVSSSSTVFEGGNKEDEVLRNYESFRPFDTVAEFSDHHYSGAGLSGHQVTLFLKYISIFIVLQKFLSLTLCVHVRPCVEVWH